MVTHANPCDFMSECTAIFPRTLFLTSQNFCQLPQWVSGPAKWRVRLPSVCPSLSCRSMSRRWWFLGVGWHQRYGDWRSQH
jgi:hypothetical protein